MDNTAIQQIQKSSGIPELIDSLNRIGTEVPLFLAPEDFKLTSLERYMENRANYRLAYKTISLSAFIKYCNINGNGTATCFVDSERMLATAIFDLGTEELPGHQRHTATVTLRKTAPYKALIDTCNVRLSQKEAAEFIEDWSDYIKINNESGKEISSKEASRSFRTMTIEAIRELRTHSGDFNHSQTAMEKIEANKLGDLPAEIIFDCEPYLDFTPVKFKVRVSVLTAAQSPQITFKIVRHEATQEELAELFLLELKDGVTKKANTMKVYIGSI